jgi:hypothetical protein
MLDFDLSGWLGLAIVVIIFSVFVGCIIAFMRAYILSKYARKRFLRGLSSFKAELWFGAIDRGRQKRLTYRPRSAEEEEGRDP